MDLENNFRKFLSVANINCTFFGFLWNFGSE